MSRVNPDIIDAIENHFGTNCIGSTMTHIQNIDGTIDVTISARLDPLLYERLIFQQDTIDETKTEVDV